MISNNNFTVKLKSGDNELTGWESVSITRSLENCAGSFTLAIYDDSPDFIPDIDELIEIYIDDVLIITGYIDQRDITISDSSYNLSISGRDKTLDIIDCGKESPPFIFLKQTLGQVAKKVCKEFDITVITDNDTDVYDNLTIEQGETIFSFLDKYASQKGFLVNSDTAGNLIIFEPSNFKTIGDIVEGYGTLSLSLKESLNGLFSKYIVKGKSSYTNSLATENDADIKRYRPIIILPDKPITGDEAKKRAKWEKHIRRARSQTIDITLDDWYINDKLILPGYLVNLESNTLRVDDTFLISEVNFNLSNSEYSSNLKLVNKDVYDIVKPTKNFDRVAVKRQKKAV